MSRAFVYVASIAMLFTVALESNAQSIPVDPKFGKVSDREVSMTTYDLDTTAVALYLYRSEKTKIVFTDRSLQRKTDYRFRIKILKNEGLDYADFSRDYITAPGYNESISNVKVSTFNIENGKITETKMSKNYLFHKTVTEHLHRASFSAQNVKVGSVIEVQYSKLSDNIQYLPDMYFQFGIPVNYAYNEFAYPEYFRYGITSRGYNRIQAESKVQARNAAIAGDVVNYDEIADGYLYKDLPAMKAESNVYYRDQYRDAISFDLKGYSIPGSAYRNFNTTWVDVDKNCRDTKFYSEVTSKRSKFKEEASSIIAGEDSDEKKIVAVRNLIASNVEWDGDIAFTEVDINGAIKNHKGNNAEINCLIGQTLNSLGFKTVPVLIKLRSSGTLLEYKISPDQFDTFILCTTDSNGKRYFFDGAVSQGYLNVLPPSYLVTKARLLDAYPCDEWVDLSKLTANTEKDFITLTANVASGQLEGTFQTVSTGEESYSLKRLYKDAGNLEEFSDILEKALKSTIIEIDTQDINSYGNSCGFKAQISYPMTVSGDRVYINPFIKLMNNDSYFKEENRTYPFDYSFAEDVKLYVNITIPDDYEFEHIPSSARFKASDGLVSSASFLFNKLNEKILQVTCSFKIDTVYITPDLYPSMRAYWNSVCAQYKDMIILKKKQ